MNKKFRCLLVSLIFTAMWNGTTIQAQAPHPERIYLSGTGIDNTPVMKPELTAINSTPPNHGQGNG